METGSATQAATIAAGGNAQKGATKLNETFDQFLTLLTTQLKHQDPLEPMESEEFVNQLVQFSEVEQSIATNQRLEDMLEFQTRNRAMSAVGLIGKTVEVAGKTLPLVNGAAELVYALPENAVETSIAVLNEAGKMVHSAGGNLAAGRHSMVWDGTDMNGNKLPDGVYEIVVSAKNAAGESMTVATGAAASVSGVETGEDDVILNLGSARVSFDNVVAVRAANQATK